MCKILGCREEQVDLVAVGSGVCLVGLTSVWLLSVGCRLVWLLSGWVTVPSGYRLLGQCLSVKDLSSGKCLLGYCLVGLLSELRLDMHQYPWIFLNVLENNCINFWSYQSCEYTWSSYIWVLNMPGFWIWCGFICKSCAEFWIWLNMLK